MDILWNCKALDHLWSDDRMVKLERILKTSDGQVFVDKQLTQVSCEMQVLMLRIWVGHKVPHLSRPPGPAEASGRGSTCRVSRLSSTWSLGQKINTLSFWRGLGDPEREASGHGTITSRTETSEPSVLPAPVSCDLLHLPAAAISWIITWHWAVCKRSFCLVLPFPFASQGSQRGKWLLLPPLFLLATACEAGANAHMGWFWSPGSFHHMPGHLCPSLFHLEAAPGWVCLCRDLGASLHLGSQFKKREKEWKESVVSCFSLLCHKHRILERLLR